MPNQTIERKKAISVVNYNISGSTFVLTDTSGVLTLKASNQTSASTAYIPLAIPRSANKGVKIKSLKLKYKIGTTDLANAPVAILVQEKEAAGSSSTALTIVTTDDLVKTKGTTVKEGTITVTNPEFDMIKANDDVLKAVTDPVNYYLKVTFTPVTLASFELGNTVVEYDEEV